MRIDLIIESDAAESAAWKRMARCLLSAGRSAPSFSLTTRRGHRVGSGPAEAIDLSIGTMATDGLKVMHAVLSAIRSAVRASGSAAMLRFGGEAWALPEGLSDRLPEVLSAHIAQALDREGDHDLRTADDVRQLLHRVTGRQLDTVVRHLSKPIPRYAMGAADGSKLLVVAAPKGRGWVIVAETANRAIQDMWTTVPGHIQLAVCLQLEHLLGDVPGSLHPIFSHMRIHGPPKILRSHFASAIGPLVTHSREVAADPNRLELIVEIPGRDEIRRYRFPRGTSPARYELVRTVPF